MNPNVSPLSFRSANSPVPEFHLWIGHYRTFLRISVPIKQLAVIHEEKIQKSLDIFVLWVEYDSLLGDVEVKIALLMVDNLGLITLAGGCAGMTFCCRKTIS